MTILGKHTVAETRALGKAVDYQFNQVDAAFKTISQSWVDAHKDEYAKLTKDWTTAKDQWTKDWRNVQVDIGLRMAAAGIAVSEDIVPSEDPYQKLLSNTAEGGRNGDDSLYTVNQKVAAITGKKVDFSKQPSQLDTSDVDLGAYKAADAAKKGVETGSKSIAPYVIGSVALLIVGAVGAKVYL